MTISWGPVIVVDALGSLLTLLAAAACAWMAWGWIRRRPDDTFRDYIFLLTLAFVFFAVSRSVGHLVKQALLYYGLESVWAQISPFSGSVNTVAFIVVFAFGIYFQRFQRVHLALREYKDNLEHLVTDRTRELKDEIVERKQAQEELAAEREQLAVTLRSIGDGVITTDIQGRVVMLNKMAEQLCGWQQDEARGRPLSEVFWIIDEETGESCPNPADAVLATGTIVTLANNAILLRRDGTQRSIADSGAPIRDPESRIIGVVLVFRDVTDRRRLEKEVMKTQKLESVGLLAGGIAHDFNNILAAILGNIDLALHRLGDKERVASLLVEAEKASLRAKGLTQQLLTFARGGSPVRRTVSIAGIVRDSALFILRGSPVSCELDFPEELWLVDIDPGQISQVVQNIILNARESMPGGGSIRVSGRNLNEPAMDDGVSRDFVEITIVDQGPGISPEIIDKLFDPYFTTKKKGSGLGLSICHSIVSQHRGTIVVASVPGEGATFTIRLPASRGKALSAEEMAGTALPVRKGMRVLLMDDEEIVSSVAWEMLVHLGHEVEVVGDGQAAVNMYQEAMRQGRRFDVVILDLTVPGGMGGKEAVRELRRIDPTARIIVASGYSNDPIMAAYTDYGFCAAVSKPFLLQELAAGVEKALTVDEEAGKG
ncbi:MAG: hybrid sensor histidine kinase/response regulator [Desulfobulbaceae bacterium]